MTLPLYIPPKDRLPEREPGGHAGLWFDKFCNEWIRRDDSWSMSSQGEYNPKIAWINTLAKRPVGDEAQITEFAARTIGLVESQGGAWEVFKTESHFVTGLGRSHPVENGFAWHPTLGTPYTPGSSIKGMVRAWAKQEGADEETLDNLLGKPDSAGDVCFLDALPLNPVKLEMDVMTPHYAGWDENNPPGDWSSPTPIPFLVSAAGTSFLFGVIPIRGASEDDAKRVMDWLGDALEWAGAGAKTAVGYGRFAPDEEDAENLKSRIERQRAERARLEDETRRREAKARAREAELASLTPIVEREIQDILEDYEGLSPISEIMDWIHADYWDGDKKIVAARWIEGRMEEEGEWKPETGPNMSEDDASI